MSSAVNIARVQCEHYDEPLGIEHCLPRLSWRFTGNAVDWVQVAYELSISRQLPGQLLGPEQVYHIESSDSNLVPWPAQALVSQEIAKVKVRSFGSDGKTTKWTSIDVEAGLLKPSDWLAFPVTCEPQVIDRPRRPFQVRASFHAPATIHTARLYITALGVYEAYINSTRIGNEVLAPGWTSYNDHLVYRTYNVTDYIIPDEVNVIGSWIGEGWYTGRLAFGGGRRNNYGTRPALLAQLVIDGAVFSATGDDGWSWSYGPLELSEILDGEVYDTRNVDPMWCEVAGLSTVWKPVELLPFPPATLVSSQAPPIRIIQRLSPVSVIKSPIGKTILDFGQNFAGFVQLLNEPPTNASGEIVLRHAEVLEHGELGVRPLRSAAATDRIILGGHVAGYVPKFTYHGFRYVEVTGWPEIKISDVVGCVAHSAMERTGQFSCSHALINRLHENVVWSTISNTVSIPTDCPQRDERLGWTGDIQVFSPTLNFLFDSSGFLKSWLRDLSVDQKKLDGVVPVTVPDILGPEHNLPFAIWGDVAVLTPYDLYLAFADLDILHEQYASATSWLNKGVVRDSRTGLWDPESVQLSDWLAPSAPPEAAGDGPTDCILVADIYLIQTTRVMAKICKLLGKDDEAQRHGKLANQLVDAFYDEYITKNGRLVSETQTALALLIQFDIFPRESPEGRLRLWNTWQNKIAKLVAKENWKVSTGFAGTPVILHALEKVGMLHHAYRMLQARDTPSWLSPVLLGATTIWERWDSMLADGSINPGSMTSFNHYALGAVANFLHSVVGGLSPSTPGWKEIIVKPQPGGTISEATTSFMSPYGLVSCHWEIANNNLELDVIIPPNSTAKIVLPGMSTNVGSGARHFSVPWIPDARFPPKNGGGGHMYGPPHSDNWEP